MVTATGHPNHLLHSGSSLPSHIFLFLQSARHIHITISFIQLWVIYGRGIDSQQVIQNRVRSGALIEQQQPLEIRI
jgi:hypothetical protein